MVVVFMVLGMAAFSPQNGSASGFIPPQQQAAPSATAKNGVLCNGEPDVAKRESRSSSVEGSGASSPSGNNKPKLSTKIAEDEGAEENNNVHGQLCRREHKEDATGEAPSNKMTPTVTRPPESHSSQQPIAMFSEGKLTIKADGANFLTIMNAVKAVTGIIIEGASQPESEQMYVDIGPLPMRDALVALLAGLNYNYLIQSASDNPQIAKRLILSLRANHAPAPVATAKVDAAPEEPQQYGGQGFQQENEQQVLPTAATAQSSVPAQPAAIPSSVPVGIDVQKIAEASHKSVGEVLSDLQKQQQEILDQAAQQQEAQQPQ